MYIEIFAWKIILLGNAYKRNSMVRGFFIYIFLNTLSEMYFNC